METSSITPTLFVSTGLVFFELYGEQPIELAREGVIYRRLDMLYYLWLRAKVLRAQQTLDKAVFTPIGLAWLAFNKRAITILGESKIKEGLRAPRPDFRRYIPPGGVLNIPEGVVSRANAMAEAQSLALKEPGAKFVSPGLLPESGAGSSAGSVGKLKAKPSALARAKVYAKNNQMGIGAIAEQHSDEHARSSSTGGSGGKEKAKKKENELDNSIFFAPNNLAAIQKARAKVQNLNSVSVELGKADKAECFRLFELWISGTLSSGSYLSGTLVWARIDAPEISEKITRAESNIEDAVVRGSIARLKASIQEYETAHSLARDAYVEYLRTRSLNPEQGEEREEE